MKVLVSAYACDPDLGSEPGVGWTWALAAARDHDVWVLTRAKNRGPIERVLRAAPEPSLRFVYLDLPERARWWKRGGLGERLYYVVWQLLARREARRLHAAVGFDVVHHVTFANVWLPALARLPDVPFVLGPVAGGQRVPVRLYRVLGVRGAMCELALLAARWSSRLNPLVRGGLQSAAVILANNEETSAALPRTCRRRAVLCSNVVVPDELSEVDVEAAGRPIAVYAGRLNRFKGVELAIRAIELAPEWELLIVGEGPDKRRLRRMASRSVAGERIRFLPWLTRSALWETVGSCRTFLFPTLKEGAGQIAAEAQALGVPVVAFAQGGPALLARTPGAGVELVPLRSRRQAIEGLAAALRGAAVQNPERPQRVFDRERVRRDVVQAYRRACTPPARPAVAGSGIQARLGEQR